MLMEEYERHQRVWSLLYAGLSGWICHKFNLSHEDLKLEGPCLLISNHVSAWDPLLVSMSLREKQVYFVASEHLFRLGLVTKLLGYLVAPIPRRKAASGSDTAKACLRHLRAGHSICLFAEGEQSWDGKTAPIFPATGKLARASGASLVTFRLEGGYLSLPRWAKGVRRGKVHGGPVRIYSPGELKAMTPAQINAAIARDIAEDAWARQRETPVAYRGKGLAEGLERALFLCPGCGRIGGLRTRGDRITCRCGFSLRYGETGFFDPPKPFPSLAEWDVWQHQKLAARDFPHHELLFSDLDLTLTRLDPEHGQTLVGRGALLQREESLSCAGEVFPLDRIENMAMVQANLLLFSCGGQYWEIRSKGRVNLRKYLAVWKEH